MEFDFAKPGIPDNVTLFQMLNYLFHLAEQPILLIIDEAQHALATQNGVNTMFAIKSAYSGPHCQANDA